MAVTQITFRPGDREGIVAIGSYLADAAKRFGVRFEDDCSQDEDIHFCSVVVSSGAENMSPLTSLEAEHFSTHGRKTDERLACQTKIETAGDLVIMTTEKKENAGEEPTVEAQNEQYRKDFAELPLEKKISELVHLEAIAFSETVSFIMNSPYLVFDKVMDVMAEFGLKKEEKSKKSARPKEHEPAAGRNKPKTEAAPKPTAKKSGPKAGAKE
ncbi:MAG: hypothetical protein ABIU09_10300 [Pyrinomonadaceae bacterium]